ncbi:MAG: thiolase family protein [Roseibium sp.]
MVERAVIIAARRTPVAPRGGAFKHLQADELAAPVLARVLEDTAVSADEVDYIILGNALYGGGNPARLAALRAGIPQTVPAMTIDTQCCSGIDAIIMGVRMIEAGAATCVIAGGAESFSRAPIRMHRPVRQNDQPIQYDRPAFAPPPFADPDLAEAAVNLADRERVPRKAQAEFAVSSHEKALSAAELISEHLVRLPGTDLTRDAFGRALQLKTAMKAPVLAGSQETGLSAATIACEADAAAAVLLVSERRAAKLAKDGLLVTNALSGGGDPSDPALVPIQLARDLVKDGPVSVSGFDAVELQEAYAVQAMVSADRLAIAPKILNQMGGALARGHPIGASGAILAVNLFHTLVQNTGSKSTDRLKGIALIAAAGGLASGIAVEAKTPKPDKTLTS